MTSERVQNGQSAKVWGTISYKGCIQFVGIYRNMNSAYYCKILDDALLGCNNRIFGENWTLQQGNVPVHISTSIKDCMEAQGVNVLE